MRAPAKGIVGLAMCLALSGGATARAQDPVEPTDLPRTGFEVRSGEPGAGGPNPVAWTTLEEEAEFLETIDDASERVAVDVVSESVQGRPLRLVRIGAPAPPDLATAAEGRTVLFTCSQHGDEPAGREGCLQRIRELAFTDDPRALQHLRTTTVLFLPAANPDASLANRRQNAQGIDVNRDHLDAVTPEG